MTELHNNLVYLATPYSRYPFGRIRAFIDATKLAARLIHAGMNVYSPIAHGHSIAYLGGLYPRDHALWLALDMEILRRCDVLAVAHMTGWEESYGIGEEIKFFEAAQRPVFDLDPVSLVMVRRRLERPPRRRIDGFSDDDAEQDRRAFLDNAPLAHAKTAREQGGSSV